VDAVLSDPITRPDGIIFHNYKRLAGKILTKAEQLGVKSIIFNAGLTRDDGPMLPRQSYQHWIAEILPDDLYAGAELLRHLLQARQALAKKPEFAVEIIAMEGNSSSQAYRARKAGFERVLKQSSRLQFRQYFPADWSRDKARGMFPAIVQRYPNVQVMWAANDNMALGLIDGARNSGTVPGKAFVTGGVDWLPESFAAIRSGQMAVSIGGHFVEGMWALILMYDYLHGKDFAEAHGTTLRTRMLALTQSNLRKFGDVLKKLHRDNLRRTDFRQFSRHHHPDMTVYPFSIEHLLTVL